MTIKLQLLNKQLDDTAEQVEEFRSSSLRQFKRQQIHEQWNALQSLWEDILIHNEEDLNENWINDYDQIQNKLELVMAQLHNDAANQRNPDETNEVIRLPRMNIPIFDGSYNNWNTFRDLYTNIVHYNTRLSKAEKMQYLKSNLRGDAEKLIQHMSISDDNYDNAWHVLTSRFENKRLLLTTLLDRLINQPSVVSDSAQGLRELHDVTKECLYSIQNTVDTKNWGPLVGHIVLRKLDKETLHNYEQAISSPRDIQTLESLLAFIEIRFQSLESIQNNNKMDNINQQKTTVERRNYKVNNSTYKGSFNCKICGEAHTIYRCRKLQAMIPYERYTAVKANNLCVNCLHSHEKEECFSSRRCLKCNKRHHTLLHMEKKANTNDSSSSNLVTSTDIYEVKPDNAQSYAVKSEQSSYNIILATALVKIKSSIGTYELLRALIDPGSQATIVTESAVQLLGLPRKRAYADITGIGNTDAGRSRGQVDLEISPRFPSNSKIHCEALVLPKLTKTLPTEKIASVGNLTKLYNELLADPSYNKPGPIDIIIGADIYAEILQEGLKKLNSRIVAQNTEFGWIISGRSERINKPTRSVISMVSFADLENQLSKFWEIEEAYSMAAVTNENTQCEEYYRNTHRRNTDGSYTVKIPFKYDVILGESKQRAVARLRQLEKKFLTHPQLEEEYKQFMQEYINLKHMVPAGSTDNVTYYIPHQAVIKNDSTTTKLRVVFDATSKSSNGRSLNSFMHTGPRLQQNISDVLLRWRKHKYAFTADIEKMYRQIKVAEEHQDYQRIMWRFNPQDPLKEYKLTTVTYGTTSAPYLAIKTLQQLALDEQDKYPTTYQILLKDFYVDDLISGADTIKDAIKIQDELIRILKRGGFNLRKWTANDKMLLDAIPEKLREQKQIEINQEDAIKTLGVHWNPSTDQFRFKVNINSNTPTKRVILSTIARLYDPLGWIAPVMIKAKLIMQELWRNEQKWDEEISPLLSQKWSKFLEELPVIETIELPRWMNYKNDSKIELHGFCDASEKAYGAVIYARIIPKKGRISTTLIIAKSKVAPIKIRHTLPRLELCGAVLLSKLMTQAKTTLEIQDIEEFTWTDSKITLAWIKGDPERWKTYVANRVAEIHTHTGSSKWRYVKSEENPADVVSRGLDPAKLRNNELWWFGPKWLQDNIELNNIINYNYETKEEERKTVYTAIAIKQDSGFADKFERFSRLSTLVRVVAYCVRFGTCSKNKPQTTSLTTAEIRGSLLRIIRITQEKEFNLEIRELERGTPLSKTSKLVTLNPFLNKDGILLVGGRIDKSTMTYNEKHPIVLPHSNHVTQLIIKDAHHVTLHGGNQLTLAHLRQQYWIINARSVVRKVINKCIICHRHKAQPLNQLMGELPAERITPSHPFTHVGIDYAGPIQLRLSKGRGTKSYKGYIAIFVCFATRGIHIEPVSDMTSETFLAALRRFISRRGLCSHIYCDNGTTFVGAKTISDRELRHIAKQNADIDLTSFGIQWHFIPPASPHFGGLWESGVKSVKHHLKRTIGDTMLTFEEITTLLYQIEACLNSRPLYPMSNDPSDDSVITPGHFLIGRAVLTPPELSEFSKTSLLSRWKHIQKMKVDFWKIWSAEYVSRLQQRHKWQVTNPNLTVGQIVLVKDEVTPPSKWPLAKIIEVHPGKDGIVRVATIFYKNNTTKRPITKLCPLPIEPSKSNSANDHRPVVSNTTLVKRTATKRSNSEVVHEATYAAHPKQTQSSIITEVIRREAEEFRHVGKRSRCTVNHKENDVSPRTTKSRFGLIHQLLSLSLVCCFLMQPLSASNEAFDISPFSDNPGIYFESAGNTKFINNHWTLVVQFKLTNYWREMYGFRKAVYQLSTLSEKCNEVYCTSIIDEVQHNLNNIEHINDILHKRSGNNKSLSRTKRGYFNAVGTIARTLFGVLDEEDAQILENKILHAENNEKHLLELLKNQTSIQDATTNILKKSSVIIDQQFEAIKNQFTNLSSNQNAILELQERQNFKQTFIALCLHLSIALKRYQDTQYQLLDVLIDIHHGKIHPLLITPDQLEVQIAVIQQHLPPSSVLPGTMDNVLAFYQVMSAKARITISNVIVDISIPLLLNLNFQLFRVLPIPTAHHNKFVFVTSKAEYMATSMDRTMYYTFTESEIHTCANELEAFICPQIHPFSTPSSKNIECEVAILTTNKYSSACTYRQIDPTPIWIKLLTKNKWIYVMDQTYTFNVVCGKSSRLMSLTGAGILWLQPNCQLNFKTAILTGEQEFNVTIDSAFIPQLNITEYLSEKHITSHVSTNYTPILLHAELEHDIHQLDKQIKNQNFNMVQRTSYDWHNIHHYTLIYVLTAALMFGIATNLWLRRRKARTPIPTPRHVTQPKTAHTTTV